MSVVMPLRKHCTRSVECLSCLSHIILSIQVDILEHKEMQLKGTERRVYSLQQQVEMQQAELSRSAVLTKVIQPTRPIGF